MANKNPKSGFQLTLNAETSKKLLRFLEDEGLMQVVFEARESGGGGTGGASPRSLKVVVSETAETEENKAK